MANDIRSSPWILDTASANPINVNSPSGLTWLTGFVFRDYLNGAASQAVFQDWRGINIAVLQGNAQGSPVGEAWLPAGKKSQVVRGLKLTAIDSGHVEVLVL